MFVLVFLVFSQKSAAAENQARKLLDGGREISIISSQALQQVTFNSSYFIFYVLTFNLEFVMHLAFVCLRGKNPSRT